MSLSYTQAGVQIPTIQNANQLFDKMFLQGAAKDVEKQKQRLRRKASILDLVMGQSKSVLKKASSIDRDKLDQYQTAVRSLEQRLYEQEAWEDKPKPKVDQKLNEYPKDKKEFFKMIELMNDISTLAFQTDSTRAITLFIGSVTTPGVNLKDGSSSSGYHNLSHHGKSGDKIELLKKVELDHMNCIKGLLSGLKNIPEQDSTLLDNTMVLYGSNMGDANIHNNKNLPILLAGGGFKHGQHLKYNQDVNEPLANLFLSMLNKMGIHHSSFSSSQGQLKNFS
jgi:BMFP domain-containing protein YqiC